MAHFQYVQCSVLQGKNIWLITSMDSVQFSRVKIWLITSMFSVAFYRVNTAHYQYVLCWILQSKYGSFTVCTVFCSSE